MVNYKCPKCKKSISETDEYDTWDKKKRKYMDEYLVYDWDKKEKVCFCSDECMRDSGYL